MVNENKKTKIFTHKKDLIQGLLVSTGLITALTVTVVHPQYYPLPKEAKAQIKAPIPSRSIEIEDTDLSFSIADESNNEELTSFDMNGSEIGLIPSTPNSTDSSFTLYNSDTYPNTNESTYHFSSYKENQDPSTDHEDQNQTTKATPPLLTWNESLKSTDPLSSYLKIGGDYTYVNLKPHGHPSLTGNLGGMQVMYEYKPNNGFYEGLAFSWKQGTTDGSGSTRSLLYLDAQELVGYTLKINTINLALSFFSGLGYRHYGQTLKVSNAPNLRFSYNEFYVPLGFISDYRVCDLLTIGFGATWMPQFYPVASISPLKGAYWKLENSLSSFSAKMPITITPTKNKKFSIVLDPFYEHWEDGKSTAKTSTGVPLGLPANNYNFWGVDLNFVYRF